MNLCSILLPAQGWWEECGITFSLVYWSNTNICLHGLSSKGKLFLFLHDHPNVWSVHDNAMISIWYCMIVFSLLSLLFITYMLNKLITLYQIAVLFIIRSVYIKMNNHNHKYCPLNTINHTFVIALKGRTVQSTVYPFKGALFVQ